ncbi:MAG TPA: VOC family protein [Kofleriaceae bacterium]|nr:VOC family protein [Kofleriaceae bacterium]
MKTFVLALALAAAACGGAQTSKPTAEPSAPPKAAAPLQIKLTTIYVDDQAKALAFYTDVVGFAKKDDVTNGGYRWLTVTAPGDADGGQLQLAANADPNGKAYQAALFAAHQPATMLFTDDCKREYERLKAKGAAFTMPPTDIGFAVIAQFDDTVGNLVQITQLH